MKLTGTIYPDGRVKLDGCEPEATVLVGITRSVIAIKHPGGAYWTNGGKNYATARIAVSSLDSLKKCSDGTYRFQFDDPLVWFHPTPIKAQAAAVQDLERMFP